jgi:hypothetical protein
MAKKGKKRKEIRRKLKREKKFGESCYISIDW